ncbi:MAG: YwaF family protein [Clostridia bacterium]|nr:YwaF family protein [Clostridia bacterium]
MKDFGYVLQNFFTHKDFLAPAEQIPGTMFTPLHFIFAAIVLAIVIVGAIVLVKHPNAIKTTFIILWASMTVFEVVKIVWESTSGKTVGIEWTGILPLYACSIYMYAMPFAIWGKGWVKQAACGYVCTLGMLGGTVNFVYPMTVLPSYSCISFAGFHTFLYHGAMLFTCIVMLASGYHRYTHIRRAFEPFLACIPTLILSIPANIVNYTVGADYMFFRGDSAFLPAIFGSVPDPLVTVIIYALYILVPAAFYLPSLISQKIKFSRKKSESI